MVSVEQDDGVHKQRWTELLGNISKENNSIHFGNYLIPYVALRTKYFDSGRIDAWNHILTDLDRFETLQTEATRKAQNSNAIKLALFFRGCSDHADQSAEFAAQVLREAQLPSVSIETVASLILVTKHTVPPNGIDEEIMVALAKING